MCGGPVIEREPGTIITDTIITRTPRVSEEEMTMAWTTPTLVEICIGLEINGYLPAEF